MKPACESAFQCKIDLYDSRDKTIAMVAFGSDDNGGVDFVIHIYEQGDTETFDFLPSSFEVDSRNLRAAAVTLPRAVELLSILQLL